MYINVNKQNINRAKRSIKARWERRKTRIV